MRKTNNREVKRINRNLVFRYINSQEKTSKPDIAKTLNLSIPTIMQMVNELKADGLLAEVGEYASTGGRKATAISSIKHLYYAVGIDITQNHIGFVLTDLSGNVKGHKRIQCEYKDMPSYYMQLKEQVDIFISEQTIRKKARLLGFGVSIPGFVSVKEKKLVASHVLQVSNVPFSKFQKVLGGVCFFMNDANAAAIAEVYHQEIHQDLIYLSLSNSVGGGIIKRRDRWLGGSYIQDLLYEGDNVRAGEFGHTTLIPGGEVCYCGKVGCADSYVSAKTLAQHTDNKLETFFERLALADEQLLPVWERYVKHLALLINNLRMIFDCPVILGGYVGSFLEPYLDQIIEKTQVRNTFEVDASYIKTCTYQVEASALGAALGIIDNFIGNV